MHINLSKYRDGHNISNLNDEMNIFTGQCDLYFHLSNLHVHFCTTAFICIIKFKNINYQINHRNEYLQKSRNFDNIIILFIINVKFLQIMFAFNPLSRYQDLYWIYFLYIKFSVIVEKLHVYVSQINSSYVRKWFL